jgi:SAM-dependent methyltransferase
MQDIRPYLSGEKLYGDDFTAEQIAQWFADEAEGYADLGARDRANYRYAYHALNIHHAYRHIGHRRFKNALGIGSAYGDEFAPIARQIERLTIIDPSDRFTSTEVQGIPTRYIKPQETGDLPLGTESVDLVTCFGVLHHIPNVSFVVREIARVLQPGGVAFIREPIISMGDWRRPRPGLTKRERGIPLAILRNALIDSGMTIVRETLCGFPLTKWRPRLDAIVSKLFAWNVNYHARTKLQKFRPTAACFMLTKH